MWVKWKRLVGGAVSILALTITGASAFETYGFRSGDTLARVQEQVRIRGEELVPVTVESGRTTSFFVRRKGASDWGPKLSFCQERLFGITQSIQGGFEAFTRIASDLHKTLPIDATQITSQHGPNGLLSDIDLSFIATPNETQSVRMFQFQGQTSVSQGWYSRDVSAPCRPVP